MNKTIFFTGLGILVIEMFGLGGYFLLQQSEEFIRGFVLLVIVGGLNFAAVMMLVGLFNDR